MPSIERTAQGTPDTAIPPHRSEDEFTPPGNAGAKPHSAVPDHYVRAHHRARAIIRQAGGNPDDDRHLVAYMDAINPYDTSETPADHVALDSDVIVQLRSRFGATAARATPAPQPAMQSMPQPAMQTGPGNFTSYWSDTRNGPDAGMRIPRSRLRPMAPTGQNEFALPGMPAEISQRIAKEVFLAELNDLPRDSVRAFRRLAHQLPPGAEAEAHSAMIQKALSFHDVLNRQLALSELARHLPRGAEAQAHAALCRASEHIFGSSELRFYLTDLSCNLPPGHEEAALQQIMLLIPRPDADDLMFPQLNDDDLADLFGPLSFKTVNFPDLRSELKRKALRLPNGSARQIATWHIDKVDIYAGGAPPTPAIYAALKARAASIPDGKARTVAWCDVISGRPRYDDVGEFNEFLSLATNVNGNKARTLLLATLAHNLPRDPAEFVTAHRAILDASATLDFLRANVLEALGANVLPERAAEMHATLRAATKTMTIGDQLFAIPALADSIPDADFAAGYAELYDMAANLDSFGGQFLIDPVLRALADRAARHFGVQT